MKQMANSSWQLAISLFRVISLSVREIFDESAYERFLARSGRTRTAASYRDFLKEGEISLARKPRCC